MAGAEVVYWKELGSNVNWAEGWYRLGIVCLRQKKLLDALSHFDRVRKMNYKIAESWNFQGIALGWLERSDEAAFAFSQAIAAAPQFADAFLNLGKAMRSKNRLHEAAMALSQAVAIDPYNVSALANLSAVFLGQGQAIKAVEYLQRLLQIQPRHVPSIISISSIYAKLGNSLEAEQGFRTAIQIAPNLSDAHIALGVFLGEQKQFEEAAASFEQAVFLDPNSVEALSNLGNAQRELGQLKQAELNLQKAIDLEPGNAKAHLNMGTLRFDQRELDLAIHHYNRSLGVDPNNASCQLGLGTVLAEQGDFDDAEAHYRRAIKEAPSMAQSYHNLAMIQLLRGNWDEGFKTFEWRWKTSRFHLRDFKQPNWNGERLTSETLFLYCEQGFGDTLQFCRYIQLVKERAANIVLEAPPPLIPLLSSCPGVNRVVAVGDELPKFDFHVPLMSLPRIFETTVNSVPCNIPYLSAEPERIERWKKRLGNEIAFRIGIAWRGSPAYRRDSDRSLHPKWFAPLAEIQGVKLISLHKEESSVDLASVKDQFDILDFGSELDHNGGAFLDTAGLMKNLDLVISIDSSPGHLAGALGVPVWLVLSRIPDWRWLLEREDTPWYPTMRLFRQTCLHEWRDVFERIECELRPLVDKKLRKA